ncbi:TRAFAC clade GTPase domain-containing protein [Clostridium sp. ZS2-4]|uniref:TRAFAC clade GTPase domain-containing protein n=1 Tax=Clostridium sp. ZS2-4 TaxID=2987703 RepID=UPI00227CFDD1|nr:hypothetical protein [Clostridium sp. ZS2-4]MCY6356009.1 hypothetical protein [Clostridium sp. ZS2-4]
MEDNNVENKMPTLEVEQSSDIDKLINDDIETLDSNEIIEEDGRSGFIKLPHGLALTVAETYPITASEVSKTIILIGPFDSGKTTIETTIYQLFQRKPFSGLYFAGSQSLFGYEERSFYTRLESKKEIATTPRTSRFADKIFLHLKLYDSTTKTKTNYLFGDISGEEIYSHLGNVETISEKMPYLKSVDSYVFILDGKQLADKNKRNGAIDQAYNMARTIFDAKLYSSSTRVQVLISKYDIIKKNDDANLETTIDKRLECIVDLLKKYVSEVTVHKVAAMPEPGDFEVGYGLEELLSTWNKPHTDNQVVESYMIDCQLDSEFNKLIYKM